MSILSKGSFTLNLGIIQIGGELSEEDRQCAWELYTEIVTRLAVYGRDTEVTEEAFHGEILSESLDSLYSFFREMRGIMRRFPVGRLETPDEYHLGKFVCSIMSEVMRPFLERWQGKYRHWTAVQAHGQQDRNPFEVQADFPELDEMLADWMNLRFMMRGIAQQLATEYSLVHSAGNNQ